MLTGLGSVARGGNHKLKAYTPEEQIHEEQVRRLRTDEDPRGREHREYVHTVDLKPKKAKTRDPKKEEALRLKMLAYEQASD